MSYVTTKKTTQRSWGNEKDLVRKGEEGGGGGAVGVVVVQWG